MRFEFSLDFFLMQVLLISIKVFNVLHPFKLMVSAFINEYLIPETCEPVFEVVKKLERGIRLDIVVVSTCLLNNPIAGSFG